MNRASIDDAPSGQEWADATRDVLRFFAEHPSRTGPFVQAPWQDPDHRYVMAELAEGPLEMCTSGRSSDRDKWFSKTNPGLRWADLLTPAQHLRTLAELNPELDWKLTDEEAGVELPRFITDMLTESESDQAVHAR